MPAEKVQASGEIDFTRPFTPAKHTALFHAPSWKLLSERQKLRYTQIYALSAIPPGFAIGPTPISPPE